MVNLRAFADYLLLLVILDEAETDIALCIFNRLDNVSNFHRNIRLVLFLVRPRRSH